MDPRTDALARAYAEANGLSEAFTDEIRAGTLMLDQMPRLDLGPTRAPDWLVLWGDREIEWPIKPAR